MTTTGRRRPVDVVVLTWNDGPLLERAVTSVLEQQGCDLHLVVVDNGSTPAAVVPDDPRVTLVRSAVNLGVAGGRNRGVAEGDAPLVLLLDSDATLGTGALAGLVDALESRPDAALVAPVFADQRPEESAGAAPTFARKLARLLGRTGEYAPAAAGGGGAEVDVDVAIGACQLFRRDAYAAVGGIDETYFYGPEDVDFCMRLRLAGWAVVQVAGPIVVHPPRRSHRQILSRRGLRHAWAVVRFLVRHRGYARRVERAPRRASLAPTPSP